MKDQFILSRLKQKDYTFPLGPFRIPEVIWSTKNPGYPKSDRGRQLSRDQGNPNNRGFTELFLKTHPDLDVIQEFPIFLDNPEEYGQTIFFLDYYIPSLGVAIELDSKTYHAQKVAKDKARDRYLLETHGIQTFRLQGFWAWENEESRETLMAQGESLWVSLSRLPKTNPPLDFPMVVVREFKARYGERLKTLEKTPGFWTGDIIVDSSDDQEIMKALGLEFLKP